MQGGNLAMEHPIPGRVEIILVASCYCYCRPNKASKELDDVADISDVYRW